MKLIYWIQMHYWIALVGWNNAAMKNYRVNTRTWCEYQDKLIHAVVKFNEASRKAGSSQYVKYTPVLSAYNEERF